MTARDEAAGILRRTSVTMVMKHEAGSAAGLFRGEAEAGAALGCREEPILDAGSDRGLDLRRGRSEDLLDAPRC